MGMCFERTLCPRLSLSCSLHLERSPPEEVGYYDDHMSARLLCSWPRLSGLFRAFYKSGFPWLTSVYLQDIRCLNRQVRRGALAKVPLPAVSVDSPPRVSLAPRRHSGSTALF